MDRDWVRVKSIIPEHTVRTIAGEKVIPEKEHYSWHTRKCIEHLNARKRAIAEYEARWPNHCHSCHAQGVHTWSENMSPLGSGHYWPMEMAEPCDDCYDRCPRCGVNLEEALPDSILVDEICRRLDKDVALARQNGYSFQTNWMEYGLDKVEIWAEQMLPCPACGWDWGKDYGSDDFAPQEDECYCWHYDDRPRESTVYEENADLYILEQ